MIRRLYIEIPGAMVVTEQPAAKEGSMPRKQAKRLKQAITEGTLIPVPPPEEPPPQEDAAVPYTPKQKKVLRARAHGWKPTGKAKGLAKVSKRKAAKMAKEPTKRAKRSRKKR